VVDGHEFKIRARLPEHAFDGRIQMRAGVIDQHQHADPRGGGHGGQMRSQSEGTWSVSGSAVVANHRRGATTTLPGFVASHAPHQEKELFAMTKWSHAAMSRR